MNKILAGIVRKMGECLNAYLPELSCSDLEEDGTVYYMNGKNGTEFDWHVNDRLSNFMVFYDDEDKLGAVKASVYRDGGMLIYVYGDRGRSIRKEIKDIFRSKVRVAPAISFESPEYINKLLYPEMSRKPVKFYDLR